MVGVYVVAAAIMISMSIILLLKNNDSHWAISFGIFYALLSMPFLKVYFTDSVDVVLHVFLSDAPIRGFVYSKEIDSLLLNGYPIFYLLTIIILIIKRVFDEIKERKKVTVI